MNKIQKKIEKDIVYHYSEVLNEVEENMEEIEEIYKETGDKLEKILFNLFKLYAIKEGIGIIYGDINQKKLQKDISKVMGDTLKKELKIIKNTLRGVAKNAHNRNSFLLEKFFKKDINYKEIDNKIINSIVNNQLKGLNFSERLYVNNLKLTQDVKSVLIDGMVNGKSITEMTKELNKMTKIGISNSKRIIRTESARVWTEAQEEAWKDSKLVKEVMFCAVLDNKTSPTCQDLHGKIYKITDNYPKPPLHPNCRSSLEFIIKDNINTDNKEIKKHKTYKTYKQWARAKKLNK